MINIMNCKTAGIGHVGVIILAIVNTYYESTDKRGLDVGV